MNLSCSFWAWSLETTGVTGDFKALKFIYLNVSSQQKECVDNDSNNFP